MAAPTIPATPTNVWDFLKENQMMGWAIIALVALFFLVIIIKSEGFKKFFARVRKVKVPGGEVELNGDQQGNHNENKLVETGGNGCPPTMVDIDVSCDYADYIWDLRDAETEELENVKEMAREATRLHVDDTLAQFRGLNHEHFNMALGTGITNPVQDHHFNTITRGEIIIVLTRQLMNIFDRNHLLEMGEDEYRRTMVSHYYRIKRQVMDSLASDWYHPNYSFDQFLKGLEDHQEHGERDFMNLMERYRNLSKRRREIKTSTREKARAARIYLRQHGKLPSEM